MSDISMTVGSALELGGLLVLVVIGIGWVISTIRETIKERKEARK